MSAKPEIETLRDIRQGWLLMNNLFTDYPPVPWKKGWGIASGCAGSPDWTTDAQPGLLHAVHAGCSLQLIEPASPCTTVFFSNGLSVRARKRPDRNRIDLLVQEGFYSNRSDFIRTAIRNQIERHAETVRQIVIRKSVDLGLRHITRNELTQARADGQMLDIRVLGLVVIASDVSAELARDTISALSVLGTLQAPDAVKAALADRIS